MDPLLECVMVEEVQSLLLKGAISKVPPGTQQTRVLLHLFHSSEKRWQSLARSQPQVPQPIAERTFIQNDSYQNSNAVYQ